MFHSKNRRITKSRHDRHRHIKTIKLKKILKSYYDNGDDDVYDDDDVHHDDDDDDDDDGDGDGDDGDDGDVYDECVIRQIKERRLKQKWDGS
jgi:hypothetical protein